MSETGRNSRNGAPAGDAAGVGVRSGVIAVTGMQREARIVGRGGETVVSGGDNSSLARKIEVAVARGGRAIISAGICGGLAPDLPVGTIVIASGIMWDGVCLPTDVQWKDALAVHLPFAVTGAIAGADAIAPGGAAKHALHLKTGALAVDMESHIAAHIAGARGLPFAALRIISDTVNQSLPPAVLNAIGPSGKTRIGVVLRSLLVQPGQLPALIRTARDSDKALASLLRCLDLLGGGFACPHLG